MGDIVYIETGNILPVDGVVFQGSNLSIDESSITGETDLIKKVPPENYAGKENPFLVSGSKVMEGTGAMIALAVGENSQWGQVKKLMTSSDSEEKTPL